MLLYRKKSDTLRIHQSLLYPRHHLPYFFVPNSDLSLELCYESINRNKSGGFQNEA